MTLVNADTGEVVAHSFEENETVIERGLGTFVEVGRALMAIRDGRQYRSAGWTDFDSYCRQRWGFTRRHSSRLIEASEVVAELRPIGPIPATESQARELSPLRDDPEAMAEVMEEVAAEAEAAGGKVTAEKVREKVAERTTTEPAPVPETAEERDQRERVEGFQRSANRLRQALAGWSELVGLRDNNWRDDIVAHLTDLERERLDKAERRLHR